MLASTYALVVLCFCITKLCSPIVGPFLCLRYYIFMCFMSAAWCIQLRASDMQDIISHEPRPLFSGLFSWIRVEWMHVAAASLHIQYCSHCKLSKRIAYAPHKTILFAYQSAECIWPRVIVMRCTLSQAFSCQPRSVRVVLWSSHVISLRVIQYIVCCLSIFSLIIKRNRFEKWNWRQFKN